MTETMWAFWSIFTVCNLAIFGGMVVQVREMRRLYERIEQASLTSTQRESVSEAT